MEAPCCDEGGMAWCGLAAGAAACTSSTLSLEFLPRTTPDARSRGANTALLTLHTTPPQLLTCHCDFSGILNRASAPQVGCSRCSELQSPDG